MEGTGREGAGEMMKTNEKGSHRRREGYRGDGVGEKKKKKKELKGRYSVRKMKRTEGTKGKGKGWTFEGKTLDR